MRESAGSLYPNQISLVASKLKALSRRTTRYKFAVHSSHKANDGFQLGKKGLKVGEDPFKCIRSNKSLILEL
jgi:hypothetical protein